MDAIVPTLLARARKRGIGRPNTGARNGSVTLRFVSNLRETLFSTVIRDAHSLSRADRLSIAHERPPTRNASAAPATSMAEPIAEEVQPFFRYFVGTSGFGGRLYAFSLPRTRKKAWMPFTLVCCGSYS